MTSTPARRRVSYRTRGTAEGTSPRGDREAFDGSLACGGGLVSRKADPCGRNANSGGGAACCAMPLMPEAALTFHAIRGSPAMSSSFAIKALRVALKAGSRRASDLRAIQNIGFYSAADFPVDSHARRAALHQEQIAGAERDYRASQRPNGEWERRSFPAIP